ncbi:MAG: SDR family oxidoreductase [Gammaproteobacteria bacterium]|nr:SDR family oxidoreductase [Gammaproteobacteria bacterium]
MNTNESLAGRVALVTGAGKGIGAACTLALAHAGAHVIAVARTASDVDQLVNQMPDRIEGWVGDVTGTDVPARIEALERLDILVNNAGTNRPQPVAEVTDEALAQVLDLNIRAAFVIARSAVRVMLRAGHGGSLVFMSSQMGHVGAPDRSVYCASKHAVEGMAKAMAVELAPRGIRVNTVAPTFVETPMTRPMLDDPAFRDSVLGSIPMGRLATPEEIAAAVVFLASGDAGMVTGTSLRVDGGWTAR